LEDPISKVPQDGRDVRAYSNNSCSCSTFAVPCGNFRWAVLWQINTLRQRVKDEILERRSNIWKIPYNCLADFPHLDETELRNITCGAYQLKLSIKEKEQRLVASESG
jgi:hypothetical protein